MNAESAAKRVIELGNKPSSIAAGVEYDTALRTLSPKIAEALLVAMQILDDWAPLIPNYDDICDAFQRIEKIFAEEK